MDRQALVDIASPFIHREKELLKANPFARIGIFAGVEVKALYEKLGDKILLVTNLVKITLKVAES